MLKGVADGYVSNIKIYTYNKSNTFEKNEQSLDNNAYNKIKKNVGTIKTSKYKKILTF
jgi:hypothetical protein